MTEFGESAKPTRILSQFANYGFIAVLGLAQRLHIRFLPITWQTAIDPFGKGGQARIHQALVNIQTSFAFKRFKHSNQDLFGETVQEMIVLSHPVIREHEHIVTLEGICWDIPQDERVWPVLVFQKSHFGDLDKFARLEKFKSLSTEDKLSLCADVGIAIRDMHHNGSIFCSQS
jgi:Protein tyrosine and serine/threonine kinase